MAKDPREHSNGFVSGGQYVNLGCFGAMRARSSCASSLLLATAIVREVVQGSPFSSDLTGKGRKWDFPGCLV